MRSSLSRSRSLSLMLLLAGAGFILFLEIILFAAVRGLPHGSAVGSLGHFVRENITPLAWTGYLVILCGILGLLDRSFWPGGFRHRLLLCWLWSVPAWCYFDWINFYFMRNRATGLHAWEYQGLPGNPWNRWIGYLLSFGAIAPAMFLTAEIWMRAGLKKVQTAGVRIPRAVPALSVFVGAVFFIAPFIEKSPIANLMIWVSLIFLLDPINLRLGRPSILGDWIAGRWGRTLALMAGGLTCGLLWEFWNYWALAKWTYHLPFLGWWQHVRYFEMPVPGLSGFLGFGVEVWVMWQFTLLLLHPVVEAERDAGDSDRQHQLYGCI